MKFCQACHLLLEFSTKKVLNDCHTDITGYISLHQRYYVLKTQKAIRKPENEHLKTQNLLPIFQKSVRVYYLLEALWPITRRIEMCGRSCSFLLGFWVVHSSWGTFFQCLCCDRKWCIRTRFHRLHYMCCVHGFILGWVFTWRGRRSRFLRKWRKWWEGRWGNFWWEGRWMWKQLSIPNHGIVKAIVELVILILLAFLLVPTTTAEWFETKASLLIGKIKLHWVISCNIPCHLQV